MEGAAAGCGKRMGCTADIPKKLCCFVTMCPKNSSLRFLLLIAALSPRNLRFKKGECCCLL